MGDNLKEPKKETSFKDVIPSPTTTEEPKDDFLRQIEKDPFEDPKKIQRRTLKKSSWKIKEGLEEEPIEDEDPQDKDSDEGHEQEHMLEPKPKPEFKIELESEPKFRAAITLWKQGKCNRVFPLDAPNQ